MMAAATVSEEVLLTTFKKLAERANGKGFPYTLLRNGDSEFFEENAFCNVTLTLHIRACTVNDLPPTWADYNDYNFYTLYITYGGGEHIDIICSFMVARKVINVTYTPGDTLVDISKFITHINDFYLGGYSRFFKVIERWLCTDVLYEPYVIDNEVCTTPKPQGSWKNFSRIIGTYGELLEWHERMRIQYSTIREIEYNNWDAQIDGIYSKRHPDTAYRLLQDYGTTSFKLLTANNDVCYKSWAADIMKKVSTPIYYCNKLRVEGGTLILPDLYVTMIKYAFLAWDLTLDDIPLKTSTKYYVEILHPVEISALSAKLLYIDLRIRDELRIAREKQSGDEVEL